MRLLSPTELAIRQGFNPDVNAVPNRPVRLLFRDHIGTYQAEWLAISGERQRWWNAITGDLVQGTVIGWRLPEPDYLPPHRRPHVVPGLGEQP